MKNYFFAWLSMTAVASFVVVLPSTAQRSNLPVVSQQAYNKHIRDYFAYVITGRNTPSTGLKVETAKPSISLKGNIFGSESSRLVTNLELEGGLENGLMQVAAGGKVSTYFKGNIGLNYLTYIGQTPTFRITPLEYDFTQRAFLAYRTLQSSQIDSFAVISAMLDEVHTSFETLVQRSVDNARELGATVDHYTLEPTHFTALTRGVLLKYLGVDTNSTDGVLYQTLTAAGSNVKATKILADYDRMDGAINGEKSLGNAYLDYQISATKYYWEGNSKYVDWLNLSVSVANSNFILYNPRDLTFAEENSVTTALSLSYNFLFVYPSSKHVYAKVGASAMRTNNLIELNDYEYKMAEKITVSPNLELSSTKTGKAYKGTLVEGNGSELFGEVYVNAWRYDVLPGLYVRGAYRHSNAWFNPKKFAIEIGPFWSIINSEKDAKNRLTILPYFAWSNLLPEYERSENDERGTRKPLKDLFSFNVRFGAPFYIK